ncbi:MAG: NADH:flavin oxidoreductase [Anaerolineae bacterium]|nr:NADH:flavin oxidoreductase [Anaerolineae bacterium]
MGVASYRRIASLKSAEEFRAYVAGLGIDLCCDDEVLTGEASPLRQPLEVYGRTIGNRWTAHPMEGWDGSPTGGVTELVLRRWRRFGESGAKLIWGGEAMAIRHDGRANPNQLVISEENLAGFVQLRQVLLDAHRERYGSTDDLLLGFQLTHSGRYCRPRGQPEPRVAYRHPLLDGRSGVHSDAQVLSDDELPQLVRDFVRAAVLARRAGADFVDVKHCHGYLLHEFLSAHTRPGPYGGSFENRTRLLREIVAGIRSEVPDLLIGVRLSAFDTVPFRPDPAQTAGGRLGPGIPEDYSGHLPYRYGFGVDPAQPLRYDLTETVRFLELLEALDVRLVNLSAGSPYYNPHIQRPALFPPSDGYGPPEDPLAGVARQINVVRELKARFPRLLIVGSGYSYLQEYLPHVAQYYVRHGHVDSVGLGRAMLSYPRMLADATGRGTLDRRLICRTFSDCTTAPRQGLPSGCYPLDDYYRNLPYAKKLKEAKGR